MSETIDDLMASLEKQHPQWVLDFLYEWITAPPEPRTRRLTGTDTGLRWDRELLDVLDQDLSWIPDDVY